MGNVESNARRKRQNTAKAVGAVATAVAAVALAGWGLTKLVSSSASEEDEKTNDNGKLKCYQIPRNKFEDSPFDYFPDEKTNEREKMMVGATGRFEISYQIRSDELEDSHSDSEDEETDEELQYPIVLQACRGDYQISGEKICWRFPGYGKLKMNTDGSVKWFSRKKDGSIRHINPPQAGFGGVIRNESGSLIVGFYGRLKDCCGGVLEAELWGIYKGLEIIRGRNLREVEIESDLTAAVNLINDETDCKKSTLKELVERCKATKQETGCTLKHALREGNGVADELARRGRRDRHNNFISFTTPPDKIVKRLLAADVAAASS